MLREKLSTTIHEADTSTRRRQIEAPRIDLRSRNPMVVEEDCLVTCMEKALARMPVRAPCSTDTRTPIHPCDTACRTADKSDSQAPPSLSPATPSERVDPGDFT